MEVRAADCAVCDVHDGVFGGCQHWFRDGAESDVFRAHPLCGFHCFMWVRMVLGCVNGAGISQHPHQRHFTVRLVEAHD